MDFIVKMKILFIPLSVFPLMVFFMCGVFALQIPQIEYNLSAENDFTSSQQQDFAVHAVEEFIQKSGFLPPTGTPIQCCTRTLAWDMGSLTDDVQYSLQYSLQYSQREILSIEVNKVVLSTNKSLIGNLFDDDPVYSAHIYFMVETIDGRSHYLAIELWDYGLLSPWAATSSGDGWKPNKILWLTEL